MLFDLKLKLITKYESDVEDFQIKYVDFNIYYKGISDHEMLYCF